MASSLSKSLYRLLYGFSTGFSTGFLTGFLIRFLTRCWLVNSDRYLSYILWRSNLRKISWLKVVSINGLVILVRLYLDIDMLTPTSLFGVGAGGYLSIGNVARSGSCLSLRRFYSW